MGNLYEGSFKRVNFKSAIAQFAAVIIFSIFFLMPNKSYATHAAGSDLTYKWISGNTFQVTVTFYRDCAGIAAPNNVDLNVVSFNCHQNFDVTLNKISGTGQEITFPCNASTTLCNGGSGPGIQQYVYQGNVTLPALCTDWTFSYTICCRNCAITTIQHPNPCNNNNTSPNLYVEATLDNFHFPTASSPFFSNIPEAYLCANQPFTYNQGVIDANGDSLSYKFIAAKTGNNSNVTYVGSFTSQNWISSSPAVSISPTTGDITMNPTNINEVAVAAILVTAYRHGVKVGSVIRDMQFRVSNCNPNLLPTATGINGTNNFAATICAGSTLSFTVNSNDGNPGDNVTMTWNSGITGATFSAAGSPHPTGTFSWTPTLADSRTQPYQFTVTVRDDACPNNGFQIYSFTITVPLHSFTVASTNIKCNGDNTGVITATVSGGNAPYAYKWSTNATTQTITGLTAGTYTISATDADGCVGDSSITLTQPTLIVLTPSSTPSNCFNSANGTASIVAAGGVTPYTYSWSSGQTTSSASGLTGGSSYTVSVTDANGCVKTNTIVITQPTQISATITSTTNETCNGQATGTIDLTVTGGTPGYTYKWSNALTTQDLSGLAAGTYVVTVTDTLGCTITQTQTITEPGVIVPLITSTTINNVNVGCFGDSSGTASVSVTGGSPGYSYEWSNGATDQNISGLKAGTVTVTVTDLNGCLGTGSSTLTQPDSAISIKLDSLKIYNGFNVSCNGQSNGGIFITVTGGTPGYTYAWSNTSTTDDITGLAAGTYTVTVFDFNGCQDTASFTLTAPAPFTVNVTSPTFGGGTNLSCHGQNDGSATANPAGGAAPYTYLWDNGPTTQTITGLSAGTYNVSVVDANGCSGTGSVTLTEPPTIVINITGVQVNGGANLACFGDSSATAIAVVGGGTAPFNYAWSNGATIDTAKNLAAGNVAVTVSDVNGCSSVGNFTVVQPDKISIVSSITNVRCAGGSGFGDGGSIFLNVTGGTPIPPFNQYNFNWSDGSINSDLFGVVAGIYTVTVTDQNSCSAIVTDTITQPDSIKLKQFLSIYAGGFNVSCNGLSNGIDSLVPSGGAGGQYSYFINGGLNTLDSVYTGLPAGPISIIVADNRNCQLTFDTTLTAPPAIQIVLTPNNVNCAGPASGSISAAVTGGSTPYTFNWSNADTVQNISELQTGTYILTVTDANGCTDTASATLTAPLPIIPSAIVKNITCHGANDGAITLNVTGGVAPYGFQWNLNDDTSQNLTGLSADTFKVVITDMNGCVAIDSFIVTEPDSLSITVLSPKDTIGCGTSGIASAFVTGGAIGIYDFAWSNGASGPNVIGLTVSGSSTTYSVTVTDVNGCSKTDSITFYQASPLTFDIFPQDVNGCFGDSTGSAQAFVEPGNGTAPFSYRWSAPITDTTDIVTGLVAGNYTVTVTDANGCTSEQPFTINQPDQLIIDARSLAVDVQCNGDNNGYINAIVTGGTFPYSFRWSPPVDTVQDIFDLAPGNYFVTVTDAFGCSDTSSVTIHEPPALLDTISGLDTLGCNTNTTDIAVAVGGGTPPYTYEWSTGDLTADVTGLSGSLTGTTYYVSVTDYNGCSKVDSITIYKLAPVTIDLTPTPITGCSGDSSGTVTAVVNGGQAPFKYAWSTGNAADTTADITGLKAGTYDITVTDANGCTGTQTTQVTEPAKLIADAPGGAHDVTCNDANNGIINLNVSGGTAPYLFTWAAPVTDTTQDITGLLPGIYQVTVTDAHGCMDTSSATINEPLVLTDTLSGTDTLGCSGLLGNIVAATTGGTSPYTYNWSTGETTSSISGLAGSLAGITYAVTVTDANGCSKTDSMVIVQFGAITIDLTPTPVAGCNGDSTGSISTAITGGASPFKYEWSPNTADTTGDVTGLKAGSYTVTVTDFNGCSGIQTAVVTEPAKLIANAPVGVTNVTCNGANNGIINVDVNGGTAPYTFVWSTGSTTDTTQSLTGLVPGTYAVSVTDAHGCMDTSSAVITEPLVLADTISGTDTLTCNNPTGGACVTVGGGTPPYSYNWSDGTTNACISGVAGSPTGITYTVTVVDANGCSLVDSITIIQLTGVIASVTATDILGCHGDTTGTLSASVSGGQAPFHYVWSSGPDTTANVINVSAGTYFVTVTDKNGCTGIGSGTINEPAQLVVDAQDGEHDVTCHGANNGSINADISGGTAPYRYNWSPNATDTTADVTGLAAGTYTVEVIDAHGCTATATATVNEPTALTDTLSGTDTLGCSSSADGTITTNVGGGVSPYTYEWSTGANTPGGIGGLSGSPTGITYSVTVTDANGCFKIDSFIIVQSTAVTATATATNVGPCGGDSTGVVTAIVSGGTSPYHYQWNTQNVDTTVSVTGLKAGNYQVTITDANGCSGIGSVTVLEPAPLIVTIDTLQGLSCGDTINGSLGAVISGGVSPFTYIWSDGQTTQNATGLQPGAYVLNVTDANGCSKIAVAVLSSPASLSITPTVVLPSACSDTSGLISIEVTGGSGNYSYLWSTNQTTSVINRLTGGTYYVTVTDLTGGCTKLDTFSLTKSQGLRFTPQVTPISCHGAANGGVCAQITGGTPPYSIVWFNGDTSLCVTGLAAGPYTYHVEDSRACVNNGSGVLDDGPAPQFSASGTACGGVGTVTGTAPTGYTGTWAKVSGTFTLTPDGNTASLTDITGSGPNEVSWTVTNGTCSFSDTITVETTTLTADAGEDFTTCESTDVQLRAVPTQGTTGIWSSVGGNYTFTPQDASDATVSTLVDGVNTFVWTVTNGSCTAADTVVVTKTTIAANAGDDFSTCDSNDVMLHAARPVGGTGRWSNLDGTKYTFSDASVDSSAVSTLVFGPNVFIWTVTNGNCEASDTVIVTRKTLDECDTLQLAMPTGISPNGDGFNDYFVIHGIESYPTNELKIYNRWGNLVFSYSNYTNDIGTMWQGQNKSGNLLPDGTYFDILTATSAKTGQTVTLKQYVDLRRSHGNK